MKFLFDENLSPYYARALNHLTNGQEGNTEILPLKDKFRPGTPDHVWIQALAEEGDWVVITQDRFTKNHLEAQVFKDSGLVTYMLERAWIKKRYWDQFMQIVKWWPEINESALKARPGTAFSLPWAYSTGKKVKRR